MDVYLLKYPNKSHRKSITLPSPSTDLAELMGIIAGDGGINNDWQVNITLNSILDYQYASYVCNLVQKLFNIEPTRRTRPKENTLVIVTTSTSVVDFLILMGAVKGNKIRNNIKVPIWIKNNDLYEKAFIRGLVDTDGCLYIHKHRIKGKEYRNIGLCLTNYADNFTKSAWDILRKNGIKSYLKRENTQLYLYSSASVIKYLSVFGSSNPRILNKCEEWRGRLVV